MEGIFVLIIFLFRKLTVAHLHLAYHVLWDGRGICILSPFLSSPLLEPDSQWSNLPQALE